MFRGSDKAKAIIEKGIQEGRSVLLYGDPDVDGLMSLKLMCDLFDSKGIKYTYYVNGNREHGFKLPLEQLRGLLVVAADFAMSREEITQLIANDTYIVSLDHHDIDDTMIEYETGVVINNQYAFEAEEKRYLSGAGVVYEVFSYLYPEFEDKEREAIVGITLLSDARVIENALAKKYLRTTYDSDSEYIRYLIECTLKTDWGFGAPRMDRSFIDFTLSPTINAMLRFNRTEEATNLVLGKGGQGGTNWREQQKALVDDMLNKVEVLDLPHCCILAINSELYTTTITGFIGLICSRYKGNINKSSIIFAYNKNKVLRASFRGLYDGIEYRDALRNLGLKAEGHSIAFGINEFAPNPQLWKQIDTIIAGLEENHEDTRNIIEVTNLSGIMVKQGMEIATQNCYVRDMFRTFIKYNGLKYNETKHTYRMTKDNKYELDEQGNKITKYIEYLVDGRIVKSFGKHINEGLILPLLEKGYIQLYVQ